MGFSQGLMGFGSSVDFAVRNCISGVR